MKNGLRILLCITALSVLPLLAGDGEPKPASVEQRLRETDLSLLIRQYERVKMEMFETDLKRLLLSTDDEMTESARKKRVELMERRVDILQRHAAELREAALKLGEQIAAARAK